MKCRMVLQSYFTWDSFFFFLYNYFDLHLMSEQETDMADLRMEKVLLVHCSAAKSVTFTLECRGAQ